MHALQTPLLLGLSQPTQDYIQTLKEHLMRSTSNLVSTQQSYLMMQKTIGTILCNIVMTDITCLTAVVPVVLNS